MPGKNYYILQTDISSDKEQDVLFDPGDYFKPVILFVFEGRGNLAIDKLHLSAGNNRLVLLCAAAGPATIRLLKPGTKDRADVEFLPPAIDDKAAPYVPPSAKPLTRKTLAGKWRARITLKLPPAPSIDQPHPDPGLTEQARKFVAADADDRDWEVVPVPSPNGQYSKEWCNINGESVFRKSVNIPAEWAGKDLTLSLGAIDDFDDTFFNGVNHYVRYRAGPRGDATSAKCRYHVKRWQQRNRRRVRSSIKFRTTLPSRIFNITST